jgi:hypothetical protein
MLSAQLNLSLTTSAPSCAITPNNIDLFDRLMASSICFHCSLLAQDHLGQEPRTRFSQANLGRLEIGPVRQEFQLADPN